MLEKKNLRQKSKGKQVIFKNTPFMYKDLQKCSCEHILNHSFGSESFEALEGDRDDTGMKRILDKNFFRLHRPR